MPSLTPKEAMLLAITEGKKGAGFVSPNPLVGCVILDRNGQLLAKGYHARVGEAHAEVHALQQIQDRAQLEGAQVYVTLEPCAHQGRTPSCAKALAQLPLQSVTYGLVDPNPLVAGKGAEILRQAGIETQIFEGLESELEELAEIFLCNMRAKRPFVAIKVASTLDGKVAMADGTSQWITGEAARAHVHFLRGHYDAVLVGFGTWQHDDPRLNSRDSRFAGRRQRAVLLDPAGQSAPGLLNSRLLAVRAPEDLILVTGPGVSVTTAVRHLQLPLQGGEFDVAQLLEALNAEGVKSIFVEGGAKTYGAFLRTGMIDRVYAFFAPLILGEGLSWPISFEGSSLANAPRLRSVRSDVYGEDLLVTGRVHMSGSQ